MCGADVAAPQQVRRREAQPLADFFRSFQQQFTEREWAGIRSAGDEEAQQAQFRWVGGAMASLWSVALCPTLLPLLRPLPRSLLLYICWVRRKLWSLKEAFVKATGEGLGFDLGKAEFELQGNAAGVWCDIVRCVH